MIRNFCFTAMTAFSLVALAACGDDGKTTAAATETGTGTDGTTTTGTATTDDPTTDGTQGSTTNPGTTTTPDPTTGSPTTTDPGTTTTPGTTTEPATTTDPGTSTGPGTTTDGDPVEACKMMADPPTDCSDCVCENCLAELQACQEDPGCVAIRECAEETGCTGLDCLQSCGQVIMMHGGLGGMSAQLGLAVSGCLMDANCPCGG